MEIRLILVGYIGAVLMSITYESKKRECITEWTRSSNGMVADLCKSTNESKPSYQDFSAGNVTTQDSDGRANKTRPSPRKKCCRDKKKQAGTNNVTDDRRDAEHQDKKNASRKNDHKTDGNNGSKERCCREKTNRTDNHRRKREGIEDSADVGGFDSMGEDGNEAGASPAGEKVRAGKEAKQKSDKKAKQKSDQKKATTATIRNTSPHPELPKEYEDFLPTLNLTGMLELSLSLNQFQETMNTFDDYADEVENETGLKISERTKYMEEMDELIDRAHHILKLRLYKIS